MQLCSVRITFLVKTPLLKEVFFYNEKLILMSDIKDKVTKIIADKLVIDESEITAAANFKKDLGADSIDLVELIMEFEREFDLSIPDEKAEEIETVGDAIGFLEDSVG